MPNPVLRIGVISDTHGLLRPVALEALRGSDLILHAGDIGGPEVLEALGALAPVAAVRGNNDCEPWADALPEARTVQAGQTRIHLLHAVQDLALDPAAEGLDAVVAGHSHRPSSEMRGGVLYLNPGSAGPRRFRLPVSVAQIEVRGKTLEARLIELQI